MLTDRVWGETPLPAVKTKFVCKGGCMKRLSSIAIFSILIPYINFLTPLHSVSKNDRTDALSSATCVAKKKSIPSELSIKIFGKVEKKYNLNAEYLSNMSTVRIRAREVGSDGKISGVYIYYGIPLYFLLDGIAPLKNKNDIFDRPLDIIVTFISESGKTSNFSYGELTMCNDNNPVTLAFYRSQLLPSKGSELYQKNSLAGYLKKFRLICPGDLYDNRYLNNVVAIKFSVIKTSDHLLPKLSVGRKCVSENLFCIKNGKKTKSSENNVRMKTVSNWFRIGHGRGIKSEKLDKVTGYDLRSWLLENFGNGKPDDFFMFVGCDGYRALFSWIEIFQTSNGEKIILITAKNNISEKRGLTLGPLGDFFIDRGIWGLVCVEKVTFCKSHKKDW